MPHLKFKLYLVLKKDMNVLAELIGFINPTKKKRDGNNNPHIHIEFFSSNNKYKELLNTSTNEVDLVFE